MKVVIIGDTHFPYHSKKVLEDIYKIIKKERPHAVVQIGDLLDQYTFSRYSRSQNVATPADEIRRGLEAAQKMWNKVQSIVPKAACYQVIGNHDIRMKKRVMEQVPELETFLPDLYKFKKVRTLKSDRDYLVLDGVVYTHGWLSKSLDHAKHFNLPTVHGHRHRPEIATAGRLWSMDIGWVGDERRAPFNYTLSKLTNWRNACGIVENGLPKLILL